jgi:hypothetical protein
MMVFWVVSPFGRVDGYRLFGGTYCFHVHFSFQDEGSIFLETLVRTYKATTLSRDMNIYLVLAGQYW